MSSATLIVRRDRALGAGAPLFYNTPLHIVRGEGVYVFDADGRRYLDMYNKVPCVGRGNPVVVEAMGGIDPTERLVREALKAGKDVVTANKAMLAERGPELFAEARRAGRALAFEASVAGGKIQQPKKCIVQKP